MGTYFRDLAQAFISSFKGMSVTLKHFFSKPVTVQYPDEQMPISEVFLGKHKLDQPGCIACSQCVKMCPVECLSLDMKRHPGKVLEWHKFTVNYNHCIFCGLCEETCPTNVLHLTKEYDLSVTDRHECLTDLLSYTGLREEDYETIEKAKKAAEEKKKAAAAEKAKKAKEAKEDKEDKEDKKTEDAGEKKPKASKETKKPPKKEE